jgi:pimeloyl-ACP methyl ester carboxylesterase
LDNVRLKVRDWPGLAGPLVHVPDPLAASTLIDAVAALVAPRWRVLSVTPRPGIPYQVSVVDLDGVLSQFGFANATVVAEGLGYVTSLLLAAWHPQWVGRLLLVEPSCEARGESIEARALRVCPPNWLELRAAVQCPVTEARGAEEVVATLP